MKDKLDCQGFHQLLDAVRDTKEITDRQLTLLHQHLANCVMCGNEALSLNGGWSEVASARRVEEAGTA